MQYQGEPFVRVTPREDASDLEVGTR